MAGSNEGSLSGTIARRACCDVLAGLLALGPALAQAQDRGSAPVVKLVVPYGPGGPTDVVARLIAVPLQNLLQQTVIVENRAGAGSSIGARAVAAAPPDGRTILVGNVSTFAIVPATMKTPGYDPTKSFVPLLQLTDMASVMVTQPDFPAASVQEFVRYARANPGKVSYGSAGVGNSAHLMGEMIQSRARIDIVHVPYRSGSEMSMAVLSGQVQFGITDLSASLQQIREGKLKALAVTGLARSADLPNVPTMIEAGYPDIVLRNWTGSAVPAGTPPAVAKRIEAALNEILRSPEFQASIAKLGGEARPGTSEEFGALVAAEYKKWLEVAKAAGISLE